eukprot:15342109-Ditylum_brightwellii.AAC.1
MSPTSSPLASTLPPTWQLLQNLIRAICHQIQQYKESTLQNFHSHCPHDAKGEQDIIGDFARIETEQLLPILAKIKLLLPPQASPTPPTTESKPDTTSNSLLKTSSTK